MSKSKELLQAINEKKSGAYNLLRQINSFDTQRQNYLTALKKLEEEIIKLEQEYGKLNNAISASSKKS